MNRKRMRRERFSELEDSIERIQLEVDEITPQKTLSTRYVAPIERDVDCLYKSNCDLPSCLGCRRLK